MKIFFLKEHSLYKIFKTLEKVIDQKTIHIYIDPEHPFFENERRGKQIKELLEKKKLNAFFITKNEKSKRFFQNIGLKIIHQEENKFLKYINISYMFFFNIKKFHLYVYNKKNFVFYVVFFFEAAFILGILYLLYTLILPSVKIKVIPAHHIESVIYNFRYYSHNDINFPENSRFLSIPYYTGVIDYKYDMSISSSHIKHIQNPSQGLIRIINTTKNEIPLRPTTRFITNDGRLFQTINWVTIPAAYEDIPGEIVIKVKAMEKDINDIFMGSRGNIPKGTKMYIKNLKSSFYLKEIYAKNIEDFTGGFLQTEGLVTQKDKDILSEKLEEYINKTKKHIVSENFKIHDSILLTFNDLINLKVQDITIKNKINENSPILEGSITSRLEFYYIKLDDLNNAVQAYLNQRPSEKVELITIDTNALSFFEGLKRIDGILVIPTKIDIIQGYDFNKDINGVAEEIKSEILGKNAKEARRLILAHPEISTAVLKIKPLRYTTVPKLKSRIDIVIDK